MRDTELMAKWFEDIGAGLRRRVKDLDEDALEWRADDRGNNIRETVWHMGRWIDVLQGCFAHIGEIDALLAIRERSAQRASA